MYKIRKEDIEKEKSPSELYEWVSSTFDNFKTKEEMTSLRMLTYPEIKVFIEESYPLAHFCNHFFSKDKSVKISQKVGSQSYDAKIEGHSNLEHIEITNAINGYDERFRNAELDSNGSAPAVGGITVIGTKASGKQTVEFESIAVSHDEIKEEQKKMILEIVIKKSKINYPSNTMLIVAFSDNISFSTAEDISELRLFLNEVLSPKIDNFVGLSLVGYSGKVFLST